MKQALHQHMDRVAGAASAAILTNPNAQCAATARFALGLRRLGMASLEAQLPPLQGPQYAEASSLSRP